MKPCRCGPSWLTVNPCACRKSPKGVTHRRTGIAESKESLKGTFKDAGPGPALGDGDCRAKQTKITRPTGHYITVDGRVRLVPGWHFQS